MAIGWMTNEAQADTYFTNRLSSSAWVVGDSGNTPALWTAFNRLIDCPDYNLSSITPTSEALRRAQCEMAYYMIKHLSAEDHRVGLQAQSVTQAGVIQETFGDAKLPIPPYVDAILQKAGYKVAPCGFHVATIGRDDSLGVDDKITDYNDR